MALEDMLTKLIASLDANTAALKGGGGGGKAAAATTTAATAKKEPTISFDALKAAAEKVMAKEGKPYVKRMIADLGGAKELASVKPDKYAALFKGLEGALAASTDEPGEEEEEDL